MCLIAGWWVKANLLHVTGSQDLGSRTFFKENRYGPFHGIHRSGLFIKYFDPGYLYDFWKIWRQYIKKLTLDLQRV